MPAIASRPQESGPAAGEAPRARAKRTGLAARALSWLAALALIGVLASLATGLIRDRAHPEIVTRTAPTEASSAPAPNGWGPVGDFIGRYHVVGATLQHGGKTIRLNQGSQEFTLFLIEPNQEAYEEEGREAPKVQSALLQLRVPLTVNGATPTLGSSTAPLVLLFSELTSDLHLATAKIRAGTFKGPIIGYFEGTSSAPGRVSGVAHVREIGTIRVELVRYSKTVEELSEAGFG